VRKEPGAALRLYLAGRVTVELGPRLVEERRLPGRQARLALVYLALARARSVPREELADALWGATLPPAWDGALSALVSKLRALLATLGSSDATVEGGGGYRLRLPAGAWVDVEAAHQGVELAEGALRAGRPDVAGGHAAVAASIARRPLLPGVDADWIVPRREALGQVLVRALDCLAEIALANGEPRTAAQFAQDVVRLEPYRESAHRLLMRAHALGGDRAEALRVYARCRELFLAELGAEPSPETQALHRTLLGRG